MQPPVDLDHIIVDDIGDDLAADPAAACDPTVRTASGCTLRSALRLAADRHRPTDIVLPTARVFRGAHGAYRVSSVVTLTGQGPTASIIDAYGHGPVFELRPGADLRLRSLTLFRGQADSPPVASGVAVTMRDVITTDSWAEIVRDSGSYLEYCLTNGGIKRGQYFRSVVISDSQALHALPGRPF